MFLIEREFSVTNLRWELDSHSESDVQFYGLVSIYCLSREYARYTLYNHLE